MPVIEVSFGDAGTCSITGGVVYGGSAMPELTAITSTRTTAVAGFAAFASSTASLPITGIGPTAPAPSARCLAWGSGATASPTSPPHPQSCG